MPEEALGELLDLVIDHRGKTPKKFGGDFVALGVPVVSAVNIKAGRLVLDDPPRCISLEMARRWMPVPVRLGDVLLTSEAPLGEVARVPSDDALVLGQRVFGLRGKEGVLDSGYLFYLLQWSHIRNRLEERSTGTTVHGIRQSELLQVKVPLRDIAEQRAIAEVLGSLDDKIEINRRIMRSMLELALEIWRLYSRAAPTVPLAKVVEVGLSGVWGEDSQTESATAEVFCLRGKDLEDMVLRSDPVPPTRWLSAKQFERRDSERTEIWTAGSGSLGPTLLVNDAVRRSFDRPILYSNFVKRLVALPGQEHLLPSAWFSLMEAWRQGDFAAFTTGTAMPNLASDALRSGIAVPVLEGPHERDLLSLVDLALDPAPLRERRSLIAMREALLPKLMAGQVVVVPGGERV